MFSDGCSLIHNIPLSSLSCVVAFDRPTIRLDPLKVWLSSVGCQSAGLRCDTTTIRLEHLPLRTGLGCLWMMRRFSRARGGGVDRRGERCVVKVRMVFVSRTEVVILNIKSGKSSLKLIMVSMMCFSQ